MRIWIHSLRTSDGRRTCYVIMTSRSSRCDQACLSVQSGAHCWPMSRANYRAHSLHATGWSIAITPTLDTKRLMRCSVVCACFSAAPAYMHAPNFCYCCCCCCMQLHSSQNVLDGCREHDNGNDNNDNNYNNNSKLVNKQKRWTIKQCN